MKPGDIKSHRKPAGNDGWPADNEQIEINSYIENFIPPNGGISYFRYSPNH